MTSRVGPKGQVVIAKDIRDKLGVGPGWLTVQRLVDGHVEIYFVPPEHNRSLKGVLGPPPVTVHDDDWWRPRWVVERPCMRRARGRCTVGGTTGSDSW